MLLTEHMSVLRIEFGAVPTISNNTMAITVVILIVNIFLFIFDIDFFNREGGYKIYH